MMFKMPRLSPRNPEQFQSWLGCDQYLALDLDGDIERQAGHAHRRACVPGDLRVKGQCDDFGKSIDYKWLLIESGSGIHHAENAAPGGDPVQITECIFQTCQDRQRGLAGKVLGLLDSNVGANLPERAGNGAVGILRTMSGNEDTLAPNAHPGKWKFDSGRNLERLGEYKTCGFEPFSDI